MSIVFDIILFLMATFLSAAQVYDLRVRHRKSREKLVCDKTKAILLPDKGYSYDHIAEVLLLDNSTIRRWIERNQEVGMDGLLADYYPGGDFI